MYPGGGGSTARPSGTENPGGWGGQTGKTLRGGGMDIFWNHTITTNNYVTGTYLLSRISTTGMTKAKVFPEPVTFIS